MNFRQLETFRWIAKLGNFSAAAERLNSTQSTVSSRIQELEQSLGVQLFDRSARNVRLTAKGRMLLSYAEEAVELATTIRTEIGQKSALSGLVRIGVGEIVALSWFPDMLNRLATMYPGIEVELVIDVTVNLNRLFDAGQLDVIFTVAPHMSPRMLSQPLGRAPMRWAASPALGLGARPLTASDLTEKPIISLSRESHMFLHIEEWFAGHGLRPRCIHGCNSITTIIAMVRNGAGIAVLPEVLIEPDVKAGCLAVLAIEAPVDHYDFFVVHERNTTDRPILAVAQTAFATTTFEGFDGPGTT